MCVFECSLVQDTRSDVCVRFVEVGARVTLKFQEVVFSTIISAQNPAQSDLRVQGQCLLMYGVI